jgi:hypothetical protein
MPNTGAPWNIPYADPTDLVRDWPALSEDVAEAVADGLDAAAFVKQVVQTVKTDTFTTSSSTYTDVTGLAAIITPKSATSRVLVIVNITGASQSATSDAAAQFQLVRDSTAIALGDADSSRTRATTALSTRNTEIRVIMNATATFMDSPGVATATTYKVQTRAAAGTIYVNRSENDSDAAVSTRTTSSITLIEVAA